MKYIVTEKDFNELAKRVVDYCHNPGDYEHVIEVVKDFISEFHFEEET